MKTAKYDKISQTAWLTAYPRIFSDIPFSEEIFSEIEKTLKSQGSAGVSETFKVSRLAPELEARYKLVNRLLDKNGSQQILELAAGYSPRGFIRSQDPSVEYVELELPLMIEKKRNILEALTLQSKIKINNNFHLQAGNAISSEDLAASARYFKKDQPITVINEGLLRYLNFSEKAEVAKNIHALLKQYGGVWITPDITLRKLLETQNSITMPGKNKEISEAINNDFDQNKFENENQAKEFFENLGFEVEIHHQAEVVGELVSPKRLGIDSDEVLKLIGSGSVFVMKPV